MRIRPKIIPLVLVLLVSPTLARAKAGRDVKDKEKAARKACMLGNYQEGVSILADLFIENGDPNYIHNQARCLQQNNRWQEALDRFREYLRKATTLKGSEKAEVEKYMRECEEHLPAHALAPEPLPLPPPEPPPQTTAPAAPIEPAITEPSTNRDETRGTGLRTAGIVTGLGGLVGIGAGVFCSVKTYSLRGKPDELSAYKRLGIISYATGGLALATGVILYMAGAFRDGESTPEGATVSFIPVLGPGSGSLFLQGSY